MKNKNLKLKINKYYEGLPRKFAPHEHKRSSWREVRNARGQIIVELLIAFGLAGILIPALLMGLIASSSGKVQQQQRIIALGLLKEGEEAVRTTREADWTNITINGNYHPVRSGNTWTLAANTETIGDFTRTITVGDLSPSDLSLKKIKINVAWSNGILPTSATSLSSTVFLARWKNLSATQSVTSALIQQGYGDWCNPSLGITALDLPKSGVANAISAIQGQIAAGTGNNASGETYANVIISDPTYPTAPVATLSGVFVSSNPIKTNDVFTEQNYGYVATDNNFKEVVILDLINRDASNNYLELGYFDASGALNGNTVATSGNVGYVITAKKGGTPSTLFSFNLSSKTGSRAVVDPDGLALADNGNRMMIVGTKLYIADESLTGQLLIVDISNPSNLTLSRSVTLSSLGASAVYVNSTGTRAYVATHQSATLKELFIVNVDPLSAQYGSVINSYDTNGMEPKGLVLVNIPRLIIVGTGAEEYQVVNIETETASPLPRCGGLQVDSGINGISTVLTTANRAYSYIITGDASTELKIIEGGAGGTGGGGGGTFESASVDAGHSVIFNRFTASTDPTTLTATYKVAVSADCTTFNYVGPSGTSSDSYSSSGGVIPLSINPGRCFRYKVTLSGGGPGVTNATTTVVVNYSP